MTYVDPSYRASTAREIARLRKRHKLSMNEMGRLTGTDHGIYSKLEREMASLSRPLCERIIVALDLGEHSANRLRLAAGFAPIRSEKVAA